MNCIVTLKIIDYYPKIDSIPYENFICLFTYGDFFGKIPLIKKINNICKHEIGYINADLKYNIHILEYNESSLIGISEMVIPFIKIKKINPPGTIVQQQKIKLIIDLNTKRKLFGKIINSSEIYLDIYAEIYIPDKKNILINNDINNNIKKKNDINKKIQVKIQKKKNNNINLEGTPRTIKKNKIILEMKSNREMIKNDNSNDNIIKSNIYNKTIIENINTIINDEKNSTGIFKKKINLDNNQIKIIDFRNKNDKFKNNEINLTTKDTKKLKLNSKRSPKKRLTILEILEQKKQPLLSKNNNNNINNRANTNYDNKSNRNENSEIKNNIKTEKKLINKSNNSNNDKIIIKNNIQNSLKRMNKNNNNINSNKIIYSPKMNNNFLSPILNFNSPSEIYANKVKRHNSNGINRINKKLSNKININNFNILNETDIYKNNYNTILIKGKRNTSQGEINRKKYKTKSHKEKDNNKKNSFKLGQHKRPKIDISEEIYQRRSLNNKVIKEYSNMNNTYNNDLTSNNGLLSTEERTEQGLPEIDRIILDKSTELRDKFQNQINNSNYLELNIKNNNKIKKNKIYNNNLINNIYLEKLYFDIGKNQIISGANYTIETPKTNKDFDSYISNAFDNKSSFRNNSPNLFNYFTQEDLKNNYIGLINLYSLLNKKLTKTILEKSDIYKKFKIYKENYNNEIKKEEIMKDRSDNNLFTLYINMKDSLTYKIIKKIAYIKNIESKLYQDIFDYNYDDYEIIRTNEIERVNKLNEERKLKILLKILTNIISDYGNVSQIFYNNKQKENFLKYVLNKYNIKEKKEGEEKYINLRNINLDNNINYKFRKYKNILNENNIFENKVIREVDEDKEEEESIYSDNKKSHYHLYLNNGINDSSQNVESIRQSLTNNQNEKKERDKNIEDNSNEIKNKNECHFPEKTPKKEEKENYDDNIIKNCNDKKSQNEEENKIIKNIKDILINKFKEKLGKNKKFTHINKNEFLFEDKYNVFIDLNNNNEIIIEIEKNKYNLEEFISKYCKDENKNEKDKFIYKRKRGKIQDKINFNNKKEKEKEDEHIDNEHQKKRRKRKIIDDEIEVRGENNL